MGVGLRGPAASGFAARRSQFDYMIFTEQETMDAIRAAHAVGADAPAEQLAIS